MRRIARLALLSLLLGVPASVPAATGPAEPAPDSLDEFDILQYVAAGRHPPSRSIALDNNARILLACRAGSSPSELRASGLEFADSQIELLRVMNLLFMDPRGDLFTTFPILDAPETTALRSETARLAEQLAVDLGADVDALTAALAARGQEQRAYSVLFSYVLDGMAWGFFEEYRRVPPRRLSARRPFWSGEVWAVRPRRQPAAGTRSITSKGVTLKLTTAGVAEPVDELFAKADAIRAALERYQPGAAFESGGESGDVRRLLVLFELLDADGRWAIPVVDEVDQGPVFRAAETLTSNLVDAVLEAVDLDGLRERYGFRTPEQALIVFYHELMWDLMNAVEGSGKVAKPAVFARADTGEAAAVAGAAFLVDSRKRTPKPEDRDEPKRDSPGEPELRGTEGGR